MQSSLQKDFAIAFYRYRMWLEEQNVSDKDALLRDTNHFLAYLTFSSTNYRKALQQQKVLQKGVTAYTRFLRSSMNASAADVEAKLLSVKNFCDFNVWSVASSQPGRERASRSTLTANARDNFARKRSLAARGPYRPA